MPKVIVVELCPGVSHFVLGPGVLSIGFDEVGAVMYEWDDGDWNLL